MIKSYGIAFLFLCCIVMVSCGYNDTSENNQTSTIIEIDDIDNKEDSMKEIVNLNDSENLIDDINETTSGEEKLSINNDTETEIIDSSVLSESNMVSDNDENGKPTVDEDSVLQIQQQMDNNEIALSGISMTINPSDCNVEALSRASVTIINNSEYDIVCGDEYELQKKVDDKWENIPLSIAWNDVGITVKNNEQHEFIYDLRKVADYENGIEYRIVKTVYYNQQSCILYSEFFVK
ncbi:MAG: hypothetical protein IJI23_05225 [Lachnospiraceae bacterium]|nr:hypothetical protein [Lachnospiraceae bacterium]